MSIDGLQPPIDCPELLRLLVDALELPIDEQAGVEVGDETAWVVRLGLPATL